MGLGCEEKIENGATIFNPVNVNDETGPGRGHCNDSVAFIYHGKLHLLPECAGACLKVWRTAS